MRNPRVRQATINKTINALKTGEVQTLDPNARNNYINHQRALALVKCGLLEPDFTNSYRFITSELFKINLLHSKLRLVVAIALSAARMTAGEREEYFNENPPEGGFRLLNILNSKPSEPEIELDESEELEGRLHPKEDYEIEAEAIATLLRSQEREYTITISNKK